MQDISNRNQSNGNSGEWGEDRSSANSIERRAYFQGLAAKANTVPLILVMNKYGIHIDASVRKITCPFKHHSNGQERTSSFNYYHSENSFWCFGCKTGRGTTDFVAAYDGISRAKAANKILRLFESSASDDWEIAACNTQEKQEQLIRFSKAVYQAISKHQDKLGEIEMITEAFDMMNNKYDLGIDGLTTLTASLLEELPQ
jgi:hypothetical protein